jgi:hypothetical protein
MEVLMRRPLCAAAALALLGLSAWAQDKPAPDKPAEPSAPAHRVRLLRSWTETVKADGQELPRRVDILFDYTEGAALERSYDVSGKLLQERKLEGAPQPSEEEIAEAFAVIEADAELGRILKRTQAVLEGGFLLQEAEGQACGPRARCLQVQLLGPTRLGLVRWVVVDIARGAIAYPYYTPVEGGVK